MGLGTILILVALAYISWQLSQFISVCKECLLELKTARWEAGCRKSLAASWDQLAATRPAAAQE